MDSGNLIESIKQCRDFDEARKLLLLSDSRRLSDNQKQAIGKLLTNLDSEPRYRIAYTGNFTLDFLPPFTAFHTANANIPTQHVIGEYNQYFQDIGDPESKVRQFNPEVIVLALHLPALDSELALASKQLSQADRMARIERIHQHLAQWIELTMSETTANVLISNFPMPTHWQMGIAERRDRQGQAECWNRLNQGLYDLVASNSRAQILDVEQLVVRHGWHHVYDSKMYLMAKIVWGNTFLDLVGQHIAAHVWAFTGRTKKCLVLDLDNTLWGGTVGEDGVAGIKIGAGDPVSEAYQEFQYRIRALKERGVILAICSKNNIGDVEEAFLKRPEMPLKLEDFAMLEVNWNDKHLNIDNIAKTLNIGLDAMVFIDDNPAECALIRHMLPEVHTVQLTQQSEKIPAVIDALMDFEKSTVLDADRNKTEQYLQNAERVKLQSRHADLSSYLDSLGTKITLEHASDEHKERVYQLFSKTNQFNVTTARYSMAEIEGFIASPDDELWIAKVRDNFGDMGIVGVVLVQRQGDEGLIDSFILSCRAMGRGVESAIMNHIKSHFLHEQGYQRLGANYYPTRKNMPVMNFFDDQGFKVIAETEDCRKTYELARDKAQLARCDWVNVTIN